ncbi:hypothetical protein FNV43_RR02853 [Rhamnella rubrinervis]|uniref:Subtilisin-like protease n=1 Tax=Rhamnella rubrinervis TaxID=2594499 RepID=A0A8K0MP11_9ROSA|nr:hypothetical protein FNV43_RR02853 [Rhamnella rubrinervis]
MDTVNHRLPLPYILCIIACFFLGPPENAISAERTTYIVHMDKSFKPESSTTHKHWYSSIVDSLNGDKKSSFLAGRSFTTTPSLQYTYDHAVHGFSASFGLEELENLKKSPGFVSAYSDKTATVDTTDFLSLNPFTGLWPASNYGEDIIIGVLDSGVWPESESFKDHGMTANIPSKWKGTCEEGQEFNASLSRDTNGHGTHTSSTAAGNYVDDVSYFGYAKRTARGVAPRSRVAVYKVSWAEGEYASDVLAGIDQAIADGVDVILISLGFNDAPLYEDPIAVASFAAMEKGVMLSSSAGNHGPGLGTLHNGIPWVLTVAAGTMDRSLAGTVILGNGLTLVGFTFFPGNATVRDLSLVYDKTLSACDSSKLLSQVSPESIVICDETWPVDDQIRQVTAAQLAGAIFISNSTQVGYFTCPGAVISPKDAYKVIKYVESSENPTVSIKFQETFLGAKPAPLAAVYSSRGPSPSYANILKPDVMAPGNLVLAAYVPSSPAGVIGTNELLPSNYALKSGTSMSCPHASGVAALLKSAHPDWSPAAIRSAMLTTANPLGNTKNPIRDYDLEFASPFAIGSGQIDPNRALDRGLIYDATPQDYVNLLSSLNFTRNQILAITRSEAHNLSSPSSDLNYPSFIALYDNQMTTSRVQKFERVVTNVGDGAAKYKVSATAPKGSEVTVIPETLVFLNKYEKQRYSLSIKYGWDIRGRVSFGAIIWVEENGNHTVRSPIVVSPVS